MKKKQFDGLSRYVVGLFSILFLCITNSYANQFFIGLVRLPDGFPAKNFFLKPDSGEEEIQIYSQVTAESQENVTNVTTSLQRGEKSYVYKGSEVFTAGQTPELISFAGVYQPDDSKLAISYKIDRVDMGNGNFSWNFTYINPFDPSTEEGLKKLKGNPFVSNSEAYTKDQTTTLIRAREDYVFPEENSISKKRKTLYTSNINEADKSTLDKLFKEKGIDKIKNLDKVVIDLNKYGKMSNVTVNYCVLNIDNSDQNKQNLRYLYWMEFDTPERPQYKAGTYKEARTIALFNEFVFKKDRIMFGISEGAEQGTEFTLEKPTRDLLTQEKNELRKLQIPESIRKLEAFNFAKQNFWIASTIKNRGIEVKFEPYVICYTWRSHITSSRSYSTGDDLVAATNSIKTAWGQQPKSNEQKDN